MKQLRASESAGRSIRSASVPAASEEGRLHAGDAGAGRSRTPAGPLAAAGLAIAGSPRMQAQRVSLSRFGASAAAGAPGAMTTLRGGTLPGAGPAPVAAPLQRTIYTMGRAAPAGASSQDIAFQNEIDVGAAELQKKHGGAIANFENDNTALTPGKNFVVGHSNGSKMWGLGGRAWDGMDLAGRLEKDLGLTTGMTVRLLACSSGVGDNSLAEMTAWVIGQLDIPGVTVKGATGEIVKTPGASGVYEDGVNHNKLSKALARVQSATTRRLCSRLGEQVAAVAGQGDMKLAEPVLNVLDLLKVNGGTSVQALEDPLPADWSDRLASGDLKSLADFAQAALAKWGEALGSPMLNEASTHFDHLMEALLPQQAHLPWLAGELAAHRQASLDAHNAWLAAPLKRGAARKPKGQGNRSFSSDTE